MERRAFFRRFIPGSDRPAHARKACDATGEPEQEPLTENELFMRAMAMGIDPATVTPGQLEALVSDAKPTSTTLKKEHVDAED
ncbi:hypothetical protein [Pseudodesulfovibrio senegalensis]|jgi:hypothetical protein|uniref:Uncharacterized protein n=1 Tax=Pseudodesulfovibrio senegalensis TaxID=1721087 RepID=A0A6N6N036_9BACT|nr:hypothetical protein [Pseudodesulfovibrio senegalensis]KAB1440272.1 hypothetical protein F8A88_13550 [Pseudodesulfovibrio senegalensis]